MCWEFANTGPNFENHKEGKQCTTAAAGSLGLVVLIIYHIGEQVTDSLFQLFLELWCAGHRQPILVLRAIVSMP